MTFSTLPDTSSSNNMDRHQAPSHGGDIPPQGTHAPRPASGEKAKARAILAAIRTLQAVEQAQRPATPEERQVLARFPGFGPVALMLFPDPVTGCYKDATWQTLGDQLQALLPPEDYASAKRTTFTAFYTAPVVMQAMYAALARLGHWELSAPAPAGHALHRGGAGPPLRTDRPRAVPRPRHPHRTLPRHPSARGPH